MAEGDDVVEEGPGPGDHPVATLGVVGPSGRSVAEGIRAVEGVVERTPTGVGGVERVPGVRHRHDQLRTRLLGDLDIDSARPDRERLRILHQVADLTEEGVVPGVAVRALRVEPVPVVDRPLQPLSLSEEGGVAGRELLHDRCEAGPEGLGCDPGPRQCLLDHEPAQLGVHVQSVGELLVFHRSRL